jgi:hypothetical protein
MYPWDMSGELDDLAQRVETLDLHADVETLAEVIGIADRLQAKIARLTGQVDAAGLWQIDSCSSLTGWLRYRGRMSEAGAVSLSRTAKRMRILPVTAQAWEDGALSGGQVQAIVANLKKATVERFAQGEADLVPLLAPLTVVQTAGVMQTWRIRAEAELDDGKGENTDRSFHHSRTIGGRYESSGSFDTDGGAVIETALRLATSGDTCGEERTPAARRADAEIEIHQFFLDHQRTHKGGRRRPHVDIVVNIDDDGAVSGRLIDGPPLPASTIKRLLCDCAVHRVVTHGRSAILDYGRSTRTVPDDLFNTLVLRDRGCRGPGCDRPAHWCDAHHVIPWEEGGPTEIDNLVLKCRRCHVQGHTPGYEDKLLPDGTYVVTDPRGRVHRSHPPGILAA